MILAQSVSAPQFPEKSGVIRVKQYKQSLAIESDGKKGSRGKAQGAGQQLASLTGMGGSVATQAYLANVTMAWEQRRCEVSTWERLHPHPRLARAQCRCFNLTPFFLFVCLHLFILFFHAHECFAYVCFLPDVCRSQKKASYPLGLELQWL